MKNIMILCVYSCSKLCLLVMNWLTFLSCDQNWLKLSLLKHLVTFRWYYGCFGGNKEECSIISFNKIIIIDIQGHSKQKDFSLKSKSVKSPICVLE